MQILSLEAEKRRVRVTAPYRQSKRRGEAPARRWEHSYTLSPHRKPGGRKSKLLDAGRLTRLTEAIECGNAIRTACVLAGIGHTSFYRWMREAEDAPAGHQLREFRDTIKRAYAAAEHRMLMIIQTAARTEWQAAAWFLERRFSQNWSQRHRATIIGDKVISPIQHLTPANALVQ